MIKKVLLFVIIAGVYYQAYSQSLHSFNNDLNFINPAFSGMLNKKQVALNTMSNHYSYLPGSVSFGKLSMHFPIKKINSVIGVRNINSKFSSFSSGGIGISYSFKYNFSDNVSLAFGSDFVRVVTRIKGYVFQPASINPKYGFIEEEDYVFINEKHIYNQLLLGLCLKIENVRLGISKQIKENHYRILLDHDARIGKDHRLYNRLFIYFDPKFEYMNSYVLFNQFAIHDKVQIGFTSIFDISNDDYSLNIGPGIGFNLSERISFFSSFVFQNIYFYSSSYHTKSNSLNYHIDATFSYKI